MSAEQSAWHVCNTCKQPIAFEQTYYLCSVSTCNRKRTGFFFCSIACWDAHVPVMRHREAWAEQIRAPSRAQWERARHAEAAKATAPAPSASAASRRPLGSASDRGEALPQDVLIVVSKLKQYIKQRADMNTSDSVTGMLSDHLRTLCDQAVAHAADDGRKTVMDRDFLVSAETPPRP